MSTIFSNIASAFKRKYALTYDKLDTQTIIMMEQNVIKTKSRNRLVVTLIMTLLSGGVLLIPMLIFYKGYVNRKKVYDQHGVDPSTVV